MGGTKRGRNDGDAAGADNVHPSRKRRMGYSEEDARRAKIFQALADDLHAERIKAAGELLKGLSEKSSDQIQQVDHTLDRLIKGLCSGRKAARLGFSIALAETLRLSFRLADEQNAVEFGLNHIVQKIIASTEPEGNASGQEKREYLLGRWFAYQAILQSDVAVSPTLSIEYWRIFIDGVVDLCSQKQWLRSECGAMLYDFFANGPGTKLDKDKTLTIIHSFNERNLLKTSEGVALWLLMSDRYTSSALPKGIWHHNDPLCGNERARLKKVLNGSATEEDKGLGHATGGTRQLQPSFAWKVIITKLFERDDKAFQQFWTEAVDHGLFSTTSSVERKSVGFQIVLAALQIAPASRTASSKHGSSLKDVLSPNIVRCIVNQRTSSERYLFEATKIILSQMMSRAKSEPAAGEDLIKSLFEADAVNFDQLTKTKTMETVLQSADGKGLKHIVRTINERLHAAQQLDTKEADTRQRALFDMYLTLLRTHTESDQLFKSSKDSEAIEPAIWLSDLLRTMVVNGFGKEQVSTLSMRTLVRTKLMSCLRLLLNQAIPLATKSALVIVQSLRTLGSDTNLNKDGRVLLDQTDKILIKIEKASRGSTGSKKSAMEAYGLLFALSVLQVYNEEPEAVEVLQDLTTSFQSWQSGDGEAASMVIEILLSFISKPSQLFRKLAEQVFTTFASELTADSLQSMLDILDQKENLSGQQELFDQHDEKEGDDGGKADEDEEEDEDEDEDDEELVDMDDVEEDSDVEIIDGQVVLPIHDKITANNDDDDDESSEADSDISATSHSNSADDKAEDEEAAFDRKLAAALGTHALDPDGDPDSDEHGSDMDDDQMMALEPHLTTIFRERKKTSNQKQDHRDAKETILNFKNRVLDLLTIFVKQQSANPLTLDLIHPLTSLVRTTSRKTTAEKAWAVLKTWFETCTRHKTWPRTDDVEACFEILAAVHEEASRGGSKLHANACSRASLFLAKVLVTMDVQNFTRIAGMYAALQSVWYADPESLVQGSIFTEWTSWSLTTRKQK